MKINELLAKSTGVSLLNHSIMVSKFAVEIAKGNMTIIDKDLLESIRLGALLHDIGKSHLLFQKKLKDIKLNEDDLEYKLPFRHNEIGWAFVKNYLNVNDKILDIILDTIYWHHGISNKMGKFKDSDILKKLKDSDINKMVNVLKELTGYDSNIINEKRFKPKSTPKYYTDNEDNNKIKLFARACVITADRFVSKLGGDDNMSDKEISELLSNTNYRELNLDISEHKHYGNERFIQQESIINDIGKTTVIKAPAGFGKTLLGLLWNFKSDNRLIWVCPRNVVAESVYSSILEEISDISDHNLSVELYLGGEVTKHNENFYSEFNSDIIVTNIDNYLAPSVNNNVANRLLSIINYDVIFDEYHELIGDNALFSSFINLMRVRSQITKSETLLLSATPTKLHELWDTIGSQTVLLPSSDSHYPAPHKKKYKINILDEFPTNPRVDSSLFVVNSISNSQTLKNKFNCDKLFHSSFTDKDKADTLEYIYDNFGKNSERINGKPNLIGTHVVQASLDISFKRLCESILSPESTLQRVGRVDRWGDFVDTPSINIINYNNPGENIVREILYTRNLSNIWFDCIKMFDGQELTLDELYEIYNSFNKKWNKILNRYLEEKNSKSLDRLANIYPIKFYNTKKIGVIKTAGGNKLRTSSNDLFVICKEHNSDKYCDPFSVSLYDSHAEDFNESGNILNRLIKTMISIRNLNDIRFDYNDIINNKKYITLDKVRKSSVKSNTPYIRFDKVYHPEYGLIFENKLID